MGGEGSGMNREQERLDKIAEIVISISKKKQKKKAVVANVMLKHGTSRRTVLEYVNCLIDAEKIEECDGLLQVIS